jgi:hypothetical protein
MYRRWRAWRACGCNRYAVGPVIAVEHFRCKIQSGYCCVAIVVFKISLVVCAVTSGCATVAASSRSLLVIVPVGLLTEIRRDLMMSGRLYRHTNAWCCGFEWASED